MIPMPLNYRTLCVLLLAAAAWAKRPIEPEDVYRVQEVTEAEISPDGNWVAYVVQKNDKPLGTYDQIWVMSTRDHAVRRISPAEVSESAIRWKPDSSAFAFFSNQGRRSAIWMAHPNGRRQMLVEAENTNHVLPTTGKRLDWSPDGRQLAYVAADPKDPKESTDPVHITRYLYKFIAGEDDNRHIHIHVLDLAAKRSRKLTDGPYYEHSIEWSPDGKEILFESNRGPLDELEFNYDIFAADANTGKERRLTNTKSQEYQATFSPDGKTVAYLGTRKDITCSETTMEDTHVWTISAEGGQGRELLGTRQLDRRCLRARWAPDGRSIYFLGQHHGNVHLYQIPAGGDAPARQVTDFQDTVTDYSFSKDGKMGYAFRSPSSPAELFLESKQVTQLKVSRPLKCFSSR
jgi:Tol biopolymer transport system component